MMLVEILKKEMTMQTINVSFSDGQYPIYIDRGLLDIAELLQTHIVANQVLIVTNETLALLFLPKLENLLKGFDSNQVILPDGEQYKTLHEWNNILDALANNHHHRDTTLIALGGGVIGDMTGFAAACYHRGVAFIQIPTTLLAQVDASIGGKTAINHPQGKNLIGAFHQPKAVIIDTDTLSTLNDREFFAGIAEIIKAALIRDKDFFEWLETHLDSFLKRNPDVLIEGIYRACKIKRDIVSLDEKELGLRALLNLGHTFGHALEHSLGYGQWLHGEAVAWGILCAAKLSQQLGWLTPSDVKRITDLLRRAHLIKKVPPEITVDLLFNAMQSDKKILNKRLRLILLKGIGEGVISNEVSDEQVIGVLREETET